MAIFDTSIVMDLASKGEKITGDITVVTLIEYPKIVEYKKFHGDVIFPSVEDFFLAYELQRKLLKQGKPKGFADLLIAAICINRGEKLITKDDDFKDIAGVSELKIELVSHIS